MPTLNLPQAPPPTPVAQYVRASTDHQRYSTEGQSESNTRYAAQHGMVIMKTYADDGRSGLNLRGRPGLMQMLEDIQHGKAAFKAVLVYDVSRWGRFQDVDESAYYEYQCRRAGINVLYCAESFGDAEGPMAAMFKAIKRAMAGEFSRDLSKKVFAGHCRLVERGYRQGGVPGYALRRLLIDEHGEPKGLLAFGERKSLQRDRVVLVPGPVEEVSVVERIYRCYVDERLCERRIAHALNAEGLRTPQGKPWCRVSIKQVLTNPKYAGVNVYNRESYKLREVRVNNPEDLWVRRHGAFEPIISYDRFLAAQAVRASATKRRTLSDEEMLSRLRGLLQQHGRLTAGLIDQDPAQPGANTVARRFGSLINAYQAVGFTTPARTVLLDRIRPIMRESHRLLDALTAQIRARGVGVKRTGANLQAVLSTGISVRLIVTRPGRERSERDSWRRKCAGKPPDLFVVYRMALGGGEVAERFVFPKERMPGRPAELDDAEAAMFRAEDEGDVLRWLTAEP